MPRRSLAVLLSVLPFVALACAPAAPPPGPAPTSTGAEPAPAASKDAEIGGWIDSYASAFGRSWGDAYAFSGYVALVRDGRVVFGKGYGRADREKGTVPTEHTLFRIGSLTKQFTAAAVLTLVEKGKIAVTDPIEKYVPEAPPSWRDITIHHLLTHTSGIPSYTSNAEFMKERDRPHTQAQMLAKLHDRPLDFEPPGSRFAYSNSGYFLLGVVIQRASGTPYEAYLREHVLGPAGMSHTAIEDAPGGPGVALGYTVDEADSVVPAHAADMSIPFAAGALRSSASDLAAWDRALAGTSVLTEASRTRMFTAFKSDYAYGVNRSTFAGHDVTSHTGAIDGFTSYLARALDERVTVIALSNNDRFEAKQIGGVAFEMALTGKQISPPAERAVLPEGAALVARVVGEYRLTEASREALSGKVPKEIIDSAMGMTISADGDRLFMKPSGQQRVRVFFGEGGVLFTKQDPLELALEPAGTATAPVVAITLTQGGISGRYERAPSP